MPRWNFAAWAVQPTSRIAVIGASGWVGKAFVDQIQAAAPEMTAERLRLFGSRAGPAVESLEASTRLGDGEWLVVHAGIIGPGKALGGEVLRRLNDELLEQVLGLTRSGDVRRLVMISSGAAHRPERSSYARMKRDHEGVAAGAVCAVLLPRIFNLGGPYINHVGQYALGDFILELKQRGRIEIGSGDPVVRSYVHVLEMAAAVLNMAVNEDERAEPFDVAGAETVELGDLAGVVAESLGVSAPVISRAQGSGGVGDIYVGEGDRYQAGLVRAGRTSIRLKQIVADTISYLRETGEI